MTIKPALQTLSIGVRFKERMQTGQFYWEVTGLTGPTESDLKLKCPKSWHIGVLHEEAVEECPALTTENGFWGLQYEDGKGYYVQNPKLTPVPVKDQVSSLGVFLDCEEGTLSFYDGDKQSHLYTFITVDSTKPLNPILGPALKPE